MKMFSGKGLDRIVSNPEQMKQAESIWKMLDNMHDSSPEVFIHSKLDQEYQSFIQKTMKEGMDNIGQEVKKENQKRTIKPKTRVSYKVKALLLKKEVTEEYKQNKRYVVTNKSSKKEQVISKEAKIYMNILSHEDMLGVLDEKDQEIEISADQDIR